MKQRARKKQKAQSFAIPSSTVKLPGGMTAFRALPKAKGKRPAMILLHERYGIVQHTRDLIIRFARAGYVALAPDLFWRFTGDKKALARGDARADIRDSEALEDVAAAIDYLKRLDLVDPARIAVMGVCQTGRQAILPATHRDDVAACVVFYGAAGGKEWTTDEFRPVLIESLLEKLSCPLLGVFGEADHIISIDDVLRFRAAVERHKKTYHIRVYPDAPHGWLNDTMPGRYRKEAAVDAWNLLLAFLKRTMTGAPKERISWIFEGDFSARYDFKKNVRME
ncbi:MAG TPA: dienelactone hydrolase family protein [Verrucomicrobiae bacterium]|jgi:carboxymethylenebutenolidase|nr:dienelactone hydrolase family protein [Verrucomicrobiae bacterium]